jgi:hypothetical protein
VVAEKRDSRMMKMLWEPTAGNNFKEIEQAATKSNNLLRVLFSVIHHVCGIKSSWLYTGPWLQRKMFVEIVLACCWEGG